MVMPKTVKNCLFPRKDFQIFFPESFVEISLKKLSIKINLVFTTRPLARDCKPSTTYSPYPFTSKLPN